LFVIATEIDHAEAAAACKPAFVNTVTDGHREARS
jgi:hypothetical protein